MNSKNCVTIFFVLLSTFLFSQEKVCHSPNNEEVSLNTIGKCAIEKFKKSKQKEYIQVSTKRNYVRRRIKSKVSKANTSLIASTKPLYKKDEITIANVHNLPLFKSCTDNISYDTKLKCFNEQLNSHITRSLKYPEKAFKDGIEDTVDVVFTINTSGEIEKIIAKSTVRNDLLETEAKRIIRSLPKFIPAQHNNTITNVKHRVKIVFDISGKRRGFKEKMLKDNAKEPLIKDYITFNKVANVPVFITCANTPEDEKQQCVKETILNTLVENFTYPFDAASQGIEGRVWVRFIVDKDGYTKNITATSFNNGSLLEEEAERLIKLLPKFIPGTHNNEYVNVEYFIPIDFQLDE